MRPNENKMSDGERDRSLLGAEVWKSSQKWSVQRCAVRSIAWLGRWREKHRLESNTSCCGFGFNSTRQPHKPVFRWCYCGVCLGGNKIKNVHDRASDMFLPGQNH